MSFFSEENSVPMNNHSLWAEKYRPDTLEGYICDSNLRSIITDFITRRDIPHLLLHGNAGTGKCLDYNECIDIEMEVTDDEYEILKKFEIK